MTNLYFTVHEQLADAGKDTHSFTMKTVSASSTHKTSTMEMFSQLNCLVWTHRCSSEKSQMVSTSAWFSDCLSAFDVHFTHLQCEFNHFCMLLFLLHSFYTHFVMEIYIPFASHCCSCRYFHWFTALTACSSLNFLPRRLIILFAIRLHDV